MSTFQVSDGTRIAYDRQDGDRPPLVFIHGAYINRGEWQPQLPALGGRAYVLLDLRGHGRSDKRGYPYSVNKFADDVVQLLDHLRLRDVILCGHSLGGMVAQHIASYYPRVATKLVLADTSYGVRSTRSEALLTDVTLPLFALTPVAWQAKLFAYQLGKRSSDAKEYVRKVVRQHTRDQRNYRAIWKAVISFDGSDKLREINVPTLIMVGALNKQTHQQARHMQECISESHLVSIEGAGHMLNWDNPEQFNRELLEFLEQ